MHINTLCNGLLLCKNLKATTPKQYLKELILVMQKLDIQYNQPMAKHLSLRTGGCAKILFSPKNIDELAYFLINNNKKILFVGLGSNLLIRDKGFDGAVISTKKLNSITINGEYINADAGASLAKLARVSSKNKYYGLEFLATIPGSVGGGLAMNAGCYNSEIWQWVNKIKTITNKGIIYNRKLNDFTIGYRLVNAKYKNEYFISASFKPSSYNLGNNIKELLQKRQKTQPTASANCGCVFINPKGYYAAKLIEESGLKGFCIGGACVAKKHANFIINYDNASTNDIENLIKYIQKTIKNNFNIKLQTELRII